MLPAGALYHKLETNSSAPEDGRNYRPKHVELIVIINKPLLLHLIGYLYNCIRDARSQKDPVCQSDIFWHYYELTLFSTLAG